MAGQAPKEKTIASRGSDRAACAPEEYAPIRRAFFEKQKNLEGDG